MALQSSGSISMDNINIEMGRTSGSQISIDDTSVRKLLGRTTGQSTISLNDGYGKSFAPPVTNLSLPTSTNYLNMNLRSFAINNGWNQTSACVITIPAGVYVYSDSTSLPALTIDGSWPGGVTLINNGYIIGKGGQGGYFGAGAPGGPAISIYVDCAITNNSYIAGGGGGGGSAQSGSVCGGGGGGAGGGNGANSTYSSYVGYGGAGGAPGAMGAIGTSNVGTGGNGGGRILPGVAGEAGGTSGVSGAGFSDILSGCPPPYVAMSSWYGGGGGGWGATGGTGGFAGYCIGGGRGNYRGVGGSANNNGGNGGSPSGGYSGGGAGGAAIILNGRSITWNAFGTRWGAIY